MFAESRDVSNLHGCLGFGRLSAINLDLIKGVYLFIILSYP